MKVETRVHMKNGETFHLPGLPDGFDSNIFNGLKKARDSNASIIVYDNNQEFERSARDVKSIEFVIL